MKKRLLISLLFPLLALWGCEREEPVRLPDDIPSDISLSPASFAFPQEGGSFTLTVSSPARPTVQAPSWVSVKDGTYRDYTISYKLSVAANEAYEERSGVLTVTAAGHSKTVSVTQAALEKPEEPENPETGEIAASLTNPKASAAARKVYDFLREQYGAKTLSGVQAGGTANNNERAEEIFKKTGKHPALVGYDYIFLQYSPTPAGWDWVVNYGDISAAKEQWEKGGLVSFMWHWNVPSSQDAWEKGKGGDFSGYNFYSDKTSFSIANALTPGTWENDFILQDIEKVAGYLKLLQQEGIPVLWRPLHEAAGNYNLYSANGAWFWWGRGGAYACKRLWKLLRDKLEGEYGLDNLIWVWTLDATPGAESQYASWYPGDDLVDLVGVDIYEDNTDAKARQYKAAVALSGGKKMTTISECGNIPEPEKCMADGESWSWFLVWTTSVEDYKYNTDSYWRQLMGSARVLTRETMPSLK